MKVVAILISIAIAVTALSDSEEWNSFKNEYSKAYKSAREESTRFGIFQENLRKIQNHNKRYDNGEETYIKGINQFTDLTEEEFANQWSLPEFNASEVRSIFKAEKDVVAASTVDWRKVGAVLDVLNQGSCGSCYAFSAVESIEGQRAIKHYVKIELSEQEVVDCAESYGTRGCSGGWMYDVYRYVKDNGLATSSDYKYDGVKGTCQKSIKARANLKLTGYTFVEKDEMSIRQAVEKVGPLAITLYHGYISSYKSGIFDHPGCPTYWNTHAVLLVGYGSENGQDYWIVKNSWGKGWGENGYIRMKRSKENLCGMFNHVMYPNID